MSVAVGLRLCAEKSKVACMNNVILQLLRRKSVRAFTDRDILPEDKALILEAAAQAPTAGNQQLYTVLDITSQELKAALVDTCDHQPFIAEAKMVLIFCADCLKWYDAFLAAECEPRSPGVGDLLLAVNDALIAAQNAVVAAESLGIGSCYIGDIMENYEQQKELLGLPDYVFPAAMLVFGYPTEQQQNRPKPPRSPKELVVHENGYHRMNGEELRRLLEVKATRPDFDEWLRAFCKRKYHSDFSREMTRSVQKYLDEYQK